MTITPLTISQLTQATVDGTGVFDILMQANKAHLEQEYAKNRIRGPEYSTVYLGSLQQVMNTALAFLLGKDKNFLEAQLLEKQIELAEVQVRKAEAELLLLQQQLPKIAAEIRLLDAQVILVTRQADNELLQGDVLRAQKCKLDAEFDLIMAQVPKVGQETALLTQKVATEKAQVSSVGVDDNSVIGKQKLLYTAQTDGFKRDAEQKAAKILVDTWNARRMTDETGTLASPQNKLDDPTIGDVIRKMLNGVGIAA